MTSTRYSIVEERQETAVVSALLAHGMTHKQISDAVRAANANARRALGLNEPPLTFDGEQLRARNVAGILRLTRAVELEIAPKFLDADVPTWREDLLAVLDASGHGSLLNPSVRASAAAANDLLSLIGQAFVDAYWAAHRRPLRQYQRRRDRSWVISGEIVTEALLPPHPEGILQERTVFSRRNPFNATLAAAADTLIAGVPDAGVRARLTAVRRALGPQDANVRAVSALPGRHAGWRPVLSLARLVLERGGLSAKAGDHDAPGFLVRSWEAWETLVIRALRIASPLGAMRAHELHALGYQDGKRLNANPDVTIDVPHRHIVDAKYRAASGRNRQTITRDALNEALVFALAAACDYAVLLYPRTPRSSGGQLPVGTPTLFSRVDALNITVVGVEVEVRGLGAQNGTRTFAKTLADGLAGIAAAHGPGEP